MPLIMRAVVLVSLLLAACGSSEGPPNYTQDVRPVLRVKCAPCHTTEAEGGFNHAVDYQATQQPSEVCAGKLVYECMLIRVQNGEMPENAGCSGSPATDSDNALCLNADQMDTLSGWVAAGAPEGPIGQPGGGGGDGDGDQGGW
jgi:hypothetical protein